MDFPKWLMFGLFVDMETDLYTFSEARVMLSTYPENVFCPQGEEHEQSQIIELVVFHRL